jgi:hypothetical protein
MASRADPFAPEPSALNATTLNVYETPSVSPVIRHDVAAVEQLSAPGLAVAVYDAIGSPPSLVGGSHVT